MILYRYITKGLPRPFFYSFLTIIMIFMMMLAVRLLPRIMHRGIPVDIIIQLFALKMVAYLALAVPLAFLVSTLMVFGRLSGDNEYTAIKAAGIGLSKLLAPIIASSGVVAVMLIFFNSSILPEANVRAQQLYRDIMRAKPAALIQPGVLLRDFKGYALMVDSVDHGKGKLFNITIFADEKDQTPSVTVADSGTLYLTEDEKQLELTLFHGETISDGGKKDDISVYQIAFNKQVIYFDNPAKEFDKKDAKNRNRNDREMTTVQLQEDIESQKKQSIQQLEGHQKRIDELLLFHDTLISYASPAIDSIVIDTSDSSAIIVSSFHEWCKQMGKTSGGRNRTVRDHIRREHHVARLRSGRLERSKLKINGNAVEIHKKYALAVSAIIFAVLGVAFGIVGRSGSLTVSIIYAVVMYVVNYVFLIGGESLANRGLVSPLIAMWSGDVVLGALAAYLIIRSSREGAIINLGRVWGQIKRPFVFPFIWISRRMKPRKKYHRRSLFEPLFAIPRKVVRFLLPTIEAYIFGRFISFFTVLIFSLITLFSVLDYVGNISRYRGALVPELFEFYQHFTISFLPMIMPIAVLLAVMMTIGSFAKTQEITAIKAAGINIIKVTVPFLVFGVFISVFNFWFNERMVVASNEKMELLQDVFTARKNNRPIPTQIKSYKRDFYYFSDKESAYRFGHFQTEPPRADRVLHYTFNDRRLISVVEAERMVYDDGWILEKGIEKIWQGDSIISTSFDERAVTNLTQQPKEMVKAVKMVEQMSYGELRHFMKLAKQRGESTEKYTADLLFKFALPLMNLVVILIGVAVTARAGKRGGAVNFGLGILLIFAYWGVSQFMLIFGRSGAIDPVVAAWGGTVIFLILGSTMYLRASR